MTGICRNMNVYISYNILACSMAEDICKNIYEYKYKYEYDLVGVHTVPNGDPPEPFTNSTKFWRRGGKYMMDIGPSLGFGVFGLIFILIYLSFFALSIYLMISAIIFFKRKTENDNILLIKLDELIRLQSQTKEN